MKKIITDKQHVAHWILGLMLLAGGNPALYANDSGIRTHNVTRGSLLLKTEVAGQYIPSPLLDTDVTMQISGMVARVRVSQQFRNTGREWAEGVYVFPLPEQAAVDSMRLRIGERVIEGQIKERRQAKRIYQQARRSGKHTSLVEQERPNMFTTSVANIAPGEQVSVEIEYLQTLTYTDNQFSLRFPLAITPRYIPGQAITPLRDAVRFTDNGWARQQPAATTVSVPDAGRITPPVATPAEELVNPVSIDITLAAGFQLAKLSSPYHAIRDQQDAEGVFHITLAEGNVPADRDFELVWKPVAHEAPVAAMFRQRYQDEEYALLMVMPPDIANMKQHVAAREFVFVIDVSGSMSGDSITQAKAALKLALERLTARDRFNIIWFNHGYGSLFPDARIATSFRVTHAKRFVEQLHSSGGTEMQPALKRALTTRNDFNTLRQVIFLTDGAVGNEEQLFKTINTHLGDNRLFTIGIGPAPNSYFMRKAAERGRGTFTYIGNTHEILAKMEPLLLKLSQPALTDLKLILPDSTVVETLPAPLPDLYLGEPVVLAMKADRLPDNLQLQGIFGAMPWQTQVNLSGGQRREGIAAVWAQRKIASFMDQRLAAHDQDERHILRENILQLALKHHLVSKFTSLVAVDITPARHNKPLVSHALKTQLPKGMNYQKVFGMAKTATPAMMHILIGMLLLVLGLVGRQWLNRTGS
ncbi:marine proteobacterial sortase target protein [Sulfuriflexus sp.]|uniref:marine proteobacterial sortase target protein n=1 Tax=Sulfuriflexus sp. TaxID=2015443 RepID=UPI0028CD768B|nr:marine proteobacterial sortase target protein [Sulfuriflexus sp.]MDT8403335.1 marine proteobacterial sortase target protein [Sulfuriflexus sp.]